MRTKVLFAALLLSATTAFAQQEKLGSGIDKTNMDLTIKPGNDFYRYAAGNWMKNHPLDAEHTDNGAFTDLFEQNQKRIQDIILEYASKPQQKGSLGQKIGSLYNLRMDSVRLNKEGWATYQANSRPHCSHQGPQRVSARYRSARFPWRGYHDVWHRCGRRPS